MKTWKSGRHKSASSANTARSAVSDLYKYTNDNEKTVGESKIVRDVIATIEKIAKPQRETKGIEQEHFATRFRYVNLSEYIEVRDYYCMLLSYGLGRRGGEMMKLETSKIQNDKTNKRMIVRHEPAKQKMREEIETVVAHAPDNHARDVGKWHELHMELREKRVGKREAQTCPLLFQTMNGEQTQ